MILRPKTVNPHFTCACGEHCGTNSFLRIHIALMVVDYPRTRCTEAHHDPSSELDVKYLAERLTK